MCSETYSRNCWPHALRLATIEINVDIPIAVNV